MYVHVAVGIPLLHLHTPLPDLPWSVQRCCMSLLASDIAFACALRWHLLSHLIVSSSSSAVCDMWLRTSSGQLRQTCM